MVARKTTVAHPPSKLTLPISRPNISRELKVLYERLALLAVRITARRRKRIFGCVGLSGSGIRQNPLPVSIMSTIYPVLSPVEVEPAVVSSELSQSPLSASTAPWSALCPSGGVLSLSKGGPTLVQSPEVASEIPLSLVLPSIGHSLANSLSSSVTVFPSARVGPATSQPRASHCRDSRSILRWLTLPRKASARSWILNLSPRCSKA